MSNSLVVGGLDLLGILANPEYRLATGMDFGTILPDTATLASLLIDGDEVTGDRTGNKTWQLNVLVCSPVLRTRPDLQTNVDTLLQALNTNGFTVAWTPDGCPTGVTAARGRATATVAKSLAALNDQLWAKVTVTFATPPFLQSTDAQSASVPASGAPAQVQVDGMNSGSFTGMALDTSVKYEGAGSGKITLNRFGAGGVYAIPSSPRPGHTISSTDLSAKGSVSVRLRSDQSSSSFSGAGQVVLSLLLHSGGTDYTFTAASQPIVVGDTAFHLFTWDISASAASLTAVTSYAFLGSQTFAGYFSPPSTIDINVDDLRAYPPASIGNSTAEGGVLAIPSIIGSARTPVNLEIDRNGSTFTTALIHSPPSSQDPDLTILAGLSAGSVTIPAANMNYDDSFSLVGICTASGSGARVVTVTVTQKIGATTVATQTWPVSISGTATIVDLSPPNAPLTLPLVKQPPENTSGSLIIAVSSSGDTWSDVALCSTSGQTVLLTGLGSAVACKAIYQDAPDPSIGGVGSLYESGSIARTAAVFCGNLATIGGGPVIFEPGGFNKLLVASHAGALGVTVGYTPSWLDEALV